MIQKLLAAAMIVLLLGVGCWAEEPMRLIVSEDFGRYEVGKPPADWRLNVAGQAMIVADPDTESGKAIRLIMDPAKQDRDTHISSPAWDLGGQDPQRLAIDYKVRWTKGRNMAFYVTGASQGHNLHVTISVGGQLVYRGTSSSVLAGGHVGPGWNHIRLIADRKRNEVYVYLNDMDQPIGGPFPFRNPIESWNKASFFLLNSYTSSNPEVSEVFYTDLKVWALEDEPENETASYHPPIRNSWWVGDIAERPLPVWPAKPASVSREEVALTVRERHGVARSAQPVTSGIPLPRGHIWDPSQTRLLNADGTERAIQSTVLSRWPDGSIRWLLLDFQTDLSAGEEADLTLEYGGDVQRTCPCEGIQVADSGDTITVDSGTVAITFGKKAPLVRSLHVQEQPWESALSPELVIQGINGLKISNTDAPYRLIVEEEGSERVVVRVLNEVQASAAGESLHFVYDLRFHFYRESGVIRIDPTITNLQGEHRIGRSGDAKIADVSLRFPGWLAAGSNEFVIGSDEGILSDEGTDISLLQLDPDSYTVSVGGDGVANGRRAPGWAFFRKGERSIGVGIRHFWEQSPKGIVADNAGDVIVQLWAPGKESLIMSGGEAKRHELYVSLNADGNETIQGMIHPLRAVASPQWYSQTEGFGQSLFVVSKDEIPLYSPAVAKYEQYVEDVYVRLMNNRDHSNEYGWRNFGDTRMGGPDGWANSEYDLAYTYFQQFARTGDLRYFELAETATRHWMDVDLIWATSDIVWLGGGMQHSPSHRTSPGDHHTWNQGMIDYYLLTGDRRALEAGRAVGDFFARLALERPERHRPRLFQNPERDVNPRSPGWALIGLVAIYESTLDPYYLQAAQTVVDFLANEQQPDGQWPYLIPENEVAGRPIRTKPFMTALVLRGLSDYYRVTGEEKALETLEKGLRFLVDELWDEATHGYPYIDHPTHPPKPGITNMLLLDAFATVYQATGDQKLLEVAVKGFEAGINHYALSIGNSTLAVSASIALRHTSQSLAALLRPQKEIALVGPSRIEMGRQEPTIGEFFVTRLAVDEPLDGRLVIQGVPVGIKVPAEIPYQIEPGQASVSIPIPFEMDNSLAPGSYSLTVGDVEKPSIIHTFSLAVPGWYLADKFDPPTEFGWFGSLHVSLTESKSQGWQYDRAPAEDFFGDSGRMRRKGSSEEFLAYDVTGLFDFKLTVYALASHLGEAADMIKIAVSKDNEHWDPILTEVRWEMTEGGAYARGTITPKERYFRGDGKLKITVLAGGSPDWIQIGHLEITGRRQNKD